jgi:hypothetical protein
VPGRHRVGVWLRDVAAKMLQREGDFRILMQFVKVFPILRPDAPIFAL